MHIVMFLSYKQSLALHFVSVLYLSLYCRIPTHNFSELMRFLHLPLLCVVVHYVSRAIYFITLSNALWSTQGTSIM